MRSSNKSHSRNRHNNNNRRGNNANIVNRVFDSNGPEGKVRGTPQQIVDKYQSLAQDSTLSGDRVNAENFMQHSEHYSRLLSEAQQEINDRREAQETQRQQQQQKQQQNKQNPVETTDAQPEIAGKTSEIFPAQAENVNLVETPESKPAPAKTPKTNKEEMSAKGKDIKKIEISSTETEKPGKATKPEAAAE